MGILTYDDLKTEIAATLARSDILASDPQIDTYIQLFEAYANLNLRHRRMRQRVAALAAVGNIVALPTDFLEVFSFNNSGTPRGMTYLPQSAFVTEQLNQGGSPSNYTMSVNASGQDQLIVDLGGTFSLTYYAKIPALSSINQTNWLLTLYPDAYLSGALYFAFRRLRNTLAADYKGLLEEAISDLITNSETTTGGGGGMQAIPTGTVV